MDRPLLITCSPWWIQDLLLHRRDALSTQPTVATFTVVILTGIAMATLVTRLASPWRLTIRRVTNEP